MTGEAIIDGVAPVDIGLDDFLSTYGTRPVQAEEGSQLTGTIGGLNTMLAMIPGICEAAETASESAKVRWLARQAGATALQPQHRHLAEPLEPDA